MEVHVQTLGLNLGYLLVQVVNLLLILVPVVLVVRWARDVQRTLREIARRQEEIHDLLRQK